MKLLLTGGTTFVSKFAAEYFVKAGNEVTVLNRGTKKQVEGVHWIGCDRMALGDTLKNRHYDAILDITAYTEEHIRSLLDSGVAFDDYIFISSSAIYPETNPQPFREEQKGGYNAIWGDYGSNKWKAEQYLMQKVPHAYILRPPYFYGIDDNLYREAFVFDCAMQDRDFYIPQNGEMKLQFFHVADLCRLMERILQKHPAQHILNCGNKDTVTVREWVAMCYQAAGKKVQFVSVDKSVPQREYFCFYDYAYVLDVSKQTALLPDTVPLMQGLQEEFAWYKHHLDSIPYRKPYMAYIDSHLKD